MTEVLPEEHEKKKVEKVCAVDFSDHAVLKVLEDYYGCNIICSSSGTEVCDDNDMVFLFEDFESKVFTNFINLCPASPVLGPMIIKTRHRQKLELPYPRARRPIYNEMLHNVIVVIGHGEENSRRTWAKLIRYMSGHVKREPDTTTNLLITTQARGRAFRQFVALGQNVVLPSWLLECWERRNDEDFTALNEIMITKHRIGVFENLRIFVHGFNQAEEEDIKKHISNNRGFIVDTSSKATHCVVNEPRDLENLDISDSQRVVTNEWVWTSINIQYCANEDTYSFERTKVRNSVSSCSYDRSAISSSDRGASDGDDRKTMKLSRPRQLCLEMYETDVSYVNAIKLLLEVKKGLEEAAESECPLMQRSEITLIFGKISPIIEVHEQIISRLRKILDNWTNDGDVAQVWVDAYEDLNRVYVPYSNAYDTAREKLISADKTSPRLHAFIRAKECNSNFNRNTMQDLLIRPVQRLPTLIVLLRELQKRRDRKSEIVERAIASIDKIVSRANDVRAQNDNFIEQLHFFNEVEGVPPHIVCSRRKVLKDVEGFSIGGSSEWNKMNRRKVKILLYNDMILICKVRDIQSTNTTGRMNSRASFSSRMTSKKHFKYFAHLLIPHVREINRVKLSQYEGVVNDRLEPQDALPIHCWTIRDASGDVSWFVEASNKEEMLDFVEEVHKKIFMDFGRDVSWPGIAIDEFPSSSVRDAVVKHIKRVIPHSQFPVVFVPNADTPSPLTALRRCSTAGLRRTVSHMGSLSRLAIPIQFLRAARPSERDEQQPYVGSQADRNLTLSHRQLNSSCSEKTTRERNLSADCVMPPIEELEKHSLSDVKDADKEN